MLNRPEYKRLVKHVRSMIEEQKATGNGLVAITRGFVGFPRTRDFEESWPRAMAELGLVDDGTGTNTYTIKGHGFRDLYQDADQIIDEVNRTRFKK